MSATEHSPIILLRQIDVIMAELQELRQTVQALLQEEQQVSERTEQPSAWDLIQAAPGSRQFHSAEDVTRYLHEERAAWSD